MFRTIISPKHVEPFNEKIKIIHKNLCISLVYIHIAIWCTVHTTSNWYNTSILSTTKENNRVLWWIKYKYLCPVSMEIIIWISSILPTGQTCLTSQSCCLANLSRCAIRIVVLLLMLLPFRLVTRKPLHTELLQRNITAVDIRVRLFPYDILHSTLRHPLCPSRYFHLQDRLCIVTVHASTFVQTVAVGRQWL